MKTEDVLIWLATNVLFQIPGVKQLVLNNFSEPGTGCCGSIVRAFMNKRNRGISEKTAELLDIGEGEVFCEVGFGSGWAIRKALEAGAKQVVGYEISQRMFDEVTAAQDLQDERVQLYLEDCKEMAALGDGSVHKMMMVNVLYFLDPLENYAREFRRVLVDGGFLFFTVNMDLVNKLNSKALFVNANTEEAYQVLQEVGFQVKVITVSAERNHTSFEIISCVKVDMR